MEVADVTVSGRGLVAGGGGGGVRGMLSAGIVGSGSTSLGGLLSLAVFVSMVGSLTGWETGSGFLLSAKCLELARTAATCHWRPTADAVGARPIALADRIDVRNMGACGGR